MHRQRKETSRWCRSGRKDRWAANSSAGSMALSGGLVTARGQSLEARYPRRKRSPCLSHRPARFCPIRKNDQLFDAAMEQSDMGGVDPPDHLTVEFQDETQHPVCRRVLRSKIDREIPERSFGHFGLFPFAATETPGTFSCSVNAPINDAFVPRPGTFIRALIWLRRGEKWRLRVRAS